MTMRELFDAAPEFGNVVMQDADKSYQLYTVLMTMIDRLDSRRVHGTGIISWGAPVLSFGDAGSARVATVGLNPSNREFLNERGEELQGVDRRFHTLHSLGISSWSDIEARHLRLVLESCRTYFHVNPYNRWFRRLDQVISATGASYYGAASTACHIDLIPYATKGKWAMLSARERRESLYLAGDAFRLLLGATGARIVVLNGQGVVDQFISVTGVELRRQHMPAWSLPRGTGRCVRGYAYLGVADRMTGMALDRQLLILGFNHNLQSSFGVTREVVAGIRGWVAGVVGRASN